MRSLIVPFLLGDILRMPLGPAKEVREIPIVLATEAQVLSQRHFT